MTANHAILCRLFETDRPLEEIASRTLSQGRLIIGRSQSVDWTLPDSRRTLSRVHCVLTVQDGRVMLEDLSTNGVFIDGETRASVHGPVALAPPQTLRMGAFLMAIETAAPDLEAAKTAFAPASSATPTALFPPVPSPGPERAQSGGSLIEAFCEGAGLDASALSSEDPAELMRRVGAIYSQTVTGLSRLMLERARIKQDHRLERTAIYSAQNNPFKWTSPRRLSEELLKGGREGFLSEARAIEASFEDVNRHLTAATEASRLACEMALATLAPDAISAEAPGQRSLLKGRQAVCWDIHNQRHARLAADENTEGSIKQAFAQAYGHILRKAAS